MWNPFRIHKHNCRDVLDLAICTTCGRVIDKGRTTNRLIRSASGREMKIYCIPCAPQWDYAVEQSYGAASHKFYKHGRDYEVTAEGETKI